MVSKARVFAPCSAANALEMASDEMLGNLKAVESCALADVVRHDPEVEPALVRDVFADARHVGGVVARGVGDVRGLSHVERAVVAAQDGWLDVAETDERLARGPGATVVVGDGHD